MPVKRAILIVGVEQYADQKIQRLRCVDNDRVELFGFFKHRAGYDDVRSLRGERSEEVLDTASAMVSTLSPGDLFVFYFCGHGCAQNSRYLMLCSDARLEDLSAFRQVIALDHLQKKTSRPGVDRVFILDSCRRELDDLGLPTAGKRSVDSVGFQGEETFRQVFRDIVVTPIVPDAVSSLAILSSCEDGKQAAELESLNHGIFTAALLGVLEDASTQRQPVAMTDQLRTSLIDRMHSLASRHGLPAQQYPSLQCEGPASPMILPAGLLEPPTGAPSPSVARPPVDEPPPPRKPVERRPVHRPPAVSTPTEASFPLSFQDAAEVQRAAAYALKVPAQVSVVLADDVKVHFRLIPAGSFMMGSPPDERGRQPDETLHSVRITRPFFMQTNLLTQAQWMAVTGTYPTNFDAPHKPLEINSFAELARFFEWPRAQHRGLRLPTEAEWEYACRAGMAGAFGGMGDLNGMGWHAGNSQDRRHTPGGLGMNAWGLFDMHGNYLEWVADRYGPYPKYPVKDPQGPSSGGFSVMNAAGQLWGGGQKRVARGGWYGAPAAECRSAARCAVPLVNKNRAMGFRLAWTFDSNVVFGPLGISDAGKFRR